MMFVDVGAAIVVVGVGAGLLDGVGDVDESLFWLLRLVDLFEL